MAASSDQDDEQLGWLTREVPESTRVTIGRSWGRGGYDRTYRVEGEQRSGVVRVGARGARVGELEIERGLLGELAALGGAWREARGDWAAYDGPGEPVPVWTRVEFRPLFYWAPASWEGIQLDGGEALASHLRGRADTEVVPGAGPDFARWSTVGAIRTGRGEPAGVIVGVAPGLVALLSRRVIVLSRREAGSCGVYVPMLMNGRGVQRLRNPPASVTPDGVAVDLLGVLCLEAAAGDDGAA